MSITLVALLVALLPPLQSGTTPTANSMQEDVDRLARGADRLTGTWPSQAAPPIPEVRLVARHGKRVAPLLVALLSDDPNVERDGKRWKVQQQVALALCRIYSEPQHCGRTYCEGDPPERIGRIKEGWLRVIASDAEMQALSARQLLDPLVPAGPDRCGECATYGAEIVTTPFPTRYLVATGAITFGWCSRPRRVRGKLGEVVRRSRDHCRTEAERSEVDSRSGVDGAGKRRHARRPPPAP